MLDETDVIRLDGAVDRLELLSDAAAIALVTGVPAEAAVPLPASLGHVGILVFPDTVEDVTAYLRRRGMVPGAPVASVVVRERLAARHGLTPARLPVTIVTGRLPGGRCLEVFVLPGLPDRDSPDGIAELERGGEAESHLAFELPSEDRARVDALRQELAARYGLLPDGGGYNPAEDVAAGGRSVFYFASSAPRTTIDCRRIELACPGAHRDSLSDHMRQTAEVADRHKARLLELVTGNWMARAVQAAATIGLPDVLRGGPRSAPDVADVLRCDRVAITRLLRYLAAIGVVVETADGRFANGPVGRLLEHDSPFHDLSVAYGQELYAAWGDFEHSLRTGGTAFAHHFGSEHFDYLGQHPEQRGRFDRAMAASTATIAERLCAAYDFSSARRIVDLGGGDGELLDAILHRHPGAAGVVFDRPEVVAALPDRGRVDGRMSGMAGSLFQEAPGDGDVYLLSRVLHDWSDEQCERILSVVRKAMTEGAPLLIVERILRDGKTAAVGLWDLHMLAISGGRERTAEEYRRLLDGTGYELVRTSELCLGFDLMIAEAR